MCINRHSQSLRSLLSIASSDPDHSEEKHAADVKDEDFDAPLSTTEDAILNLEGKLLKYDQYYDQWNLQCYGSLKLLKHNRTGKVRLVMRQLITTKVFAAHPILLTTLVKKDAKYDNRCTWRGDYWTSDGLREIVHLGIIFNSADDREKFVKTVAEVVESDNAKQIADMKKSFGVEDGGVGGCIGWIGYLIFSSLLR